MHHLTQYQSFFIHNNDEEDFEERPESYDEVEDEASGGWYQVIRGFGVHKCETFEMCVHSQRFPN